MNEDLQSGFDDAFTEVTDKFFDWGEAAIAMLPNLFVAVVVLAVFIGLAVTVRKGARKALERMGRNPAVARMIARILAVLVVAVGLIVALSVLKLDKTVTSLLAGAGVIGIALAFAFQDMAANLLAGVYMSFRQPFVIGDQVETNGMLGRVKAIDLRTTELETLPGHTVLIPNRKIFEEVLTNFTRRRTCRVSVPVGVSYSSDLELVAEVTREALADLERDESRDVEVIFTGFGGSSIDLEGRFWIPFHGNADLNRARSEAIRAIKRAYDEHDIGIPFPIRTLDFDERGAELLRAAGGRDGGSREA